jgi:AcrR family transcriptional regulator
MLERGIESNGLRERNKAKRREAILDAALGLLRAGPESDVTAERIAADAEVSVATVYNLVGTREQVLVALIDRVIDGLVTSLTTREQVQRRGPIEAARLVVDQSVEAFIAESRAYRQVIMALGQFVASGSRMTFDPAQLQVAAMRDAQQAGILRSALSAEALGRQVYYSYNGSLFAWAAGHLTDHGLLIAARHGLVTVLAAAATPRHRNKFVLELQSLGEQFGQEACHSHPDVPTTAD